MPSPLSALKRKNARANRLKYRKKFETPAHEIEEELPAPNGERTEEALDLEFREIRNQRESTRERREAVALAQEMRELVPIKLVQYQASILCVATHQRLLQLSHLLRRTLPQKEAEEARQRIYEALREMAQLPDRLSKDQLFREEMEEELEGQQRKVRKPKPQPPKAKKK